MEKEALRIEMPGRKDIQSQRKPSGPPPMLAGGMTLPVSNEESPDQTPGGGITSEPSSPTKRVKISTLEKSLDLRVPPQLVTITRWN